VSSQSRWPTGWSNAGRLSRIINNLEAGTMKPTLPLRTTLLLAPLAASHAAGFVLVAKDTPPAPIIVFKDAPPRTRDAAVTLADYIGKISGRKPAILDGEPSPLPQRAIWVGVQGAVKRLFPQTDFDFKHPEETLIVANDKHLVTAGRLRQSR
jgi:hypothetical protein